MSLRENPYAHICVLYIVLGDESYDSSVLLFETLSEHFLHFSDFDFFLIDFLVTNFVVAAPL